MALILPTTSCLYRTPVTRIEDVEEPFAVGKDVHFCPGAGGGAEWNSPAYDPLTNLIFIGEVEWCDTVKLQTSEELAAAPIGQPWTGMKALNPFNMFGKFTRADGVWAGWVYAADADTGVWKWRLKSNYPIVERHDADGRRRRVLRRHGRQLLCARCRQPARSFGASISAARSAAA